MKKIILAISVLFCTAATMTSCNNGDYDADPNTNNSGTKIPSNTGGGNGGGTTSKFDWTGTDPMSAKIDGAAFQATSASATKLAGLVNVSGTAGTGSIDFFLPENMTVGSVYNFGGTAFANYTEGSTQYSGAPAQGGSGALKIVEYDASHIKALFYFSGKNGSVKKTISEGYFNVRF